MSDFRKPVSSIFFFQSDQCPLRVKSLIHCETRGFPKTSIGKIEVPVAESLGFANRSLTTSEITMKLAEQYARVNTAWPQEVPALTGWEAVRAASRLYRWARGTTCPFEIRETSGNRRTWTRGRTLWVNPEQGWKRFIHDLSHYLDLERKPHSKHHAQLERRMIEQVVVRGWLTGTLRETEKPEPAKAEKDRRQLDRIAAASKRWESKRRRAETALKKLARQQRYYEKAVATATMQ